MTPPSFQRATSLDRFYDALDPRPLTTAEGLGAFYYKELNQVRGGDKVPRLQLELTRSFGGRFFRAFLAGHSGCGKTTELTRLAENVSGKFRVIRFSAKDEMHPSSAKPFDVLILMMIRLGEAIAKPEAEGGLGWEPDEDLSRRVMDWFAVEKSMVKTALGVGASVEAGAGADGDSLWSKALGLFAKLKGEVKYSSNRETEIVTLRSSRLPELIALVNSFFDACNGELKRRQGQEWLFLGEDFEKLLDSRLPMAFFVKESAVFSSLQTHLIFTIPVDLAWAGSGTSLPFRVFQILDTPVYSADYGDDEGREALRALLARRIDLDQIAPGQMDRFIVASGGHLRDLFYLIREAADLAVLDQPPEARIQANHAARAIATLRQEVLLRLGDDPYDQAPIPWARRAERLVALHGREPKADVPDAILHSLLLARAVQQFNGEGRFAVAPLVVDILKKQDFLPPGSLGGLLPAE
jgi:hypothetical protein